MAQQKLYHLDEEPEGWENVSPLHLLLREAPTRECIDGRSLRPRLPIWTQGTFSSMASTSGCSDLVLQPQLALGVS